MALSITPQPAPCGAVVRGIDLRQPLSSDTIATLRQGWLQHQVLAFVDQELSLEDMERVALYFGPFGTDPFFGSVPGHPNIAQVRRDADEKTPIFAESWHSDWSFLSPPPQATLLYGNVIPPVGGDTLFSNQYAAWDALSPQLQALLRDKQGIHSAGKAYSRAGAYGDQDRDKGRSMDIRPDDSALATQAQPIARVHPETGRTALYVSPGYTMGIEGMDDAQALPLLKELFQHSGQECFVYRHRWSAGTLLMWDNRCVNHAATGGYDGHARLLHRITLAERAA